MNKIEKQIVVFFLIFSLASCKSDISDLENYFIDIKKIPAKQIEPLPEINSPEIFLYEASDFRDPFSNDLQVDQSVKLPGPDGVALVGPGPDLNRRKEILENYPLDGLLMVGTYMQGENYWGLIEDPEGVITRVTVNQHLGQNYGEIMEINEDEIIVSEWISDGLGGWKKRQAELALREE
jgi:type IV pilus assembly protein PilP